MLLRLRVGDASAIQNRSFALSFQGPHRPHRSGPLAFLASAANITASLGQFTNTIFLAPSWPDTQSRSDGCDGGFGAVLRDVSVKHRDIGQQFLGARTVHYSNADKFAQAKAGNVETVVAIVAPRQRDL